MRLNHLAPAVRDQQRSIAFYATYFGFDPATARRYPDGLIIVKNGGGFALALGKDPEGQRAPAFPHFGFDTDSPTRPAHFGDACWPTATSSWRRRKPSPTSASRSSTPTGHVIEVSWET